MKYKILAIILAIAIAVSGFSIKTSAFDPTIIADLLRAIGLVTAGAVAGGAAMGLGDCLAEVINGGLDTWYTEILPNKIITTVNNVLNGNGIIVVSTPSGYTVKVNDSLSGDDLHFATILADKLNSHYNLDFLINNISNATGGITGYSLSKTAYEELKSIIGQATAEFTHNKAIEYAKENGLTLLDNGALPLYNFDFVGPMQPGLELSTMATTANEFLLDGYTIVRPFVLNETNSTWRTDEWFIKDKSSFANQHGLQLFKNDSTVGYMGPEGSYCGQYILYNNTIYSYVPYFRNDYSNYLIRFFDSLTSPSGEKLCDLISELDAQNLPRGYFYYFPSDSSDYRRYITSASDIGDDSFTTPITPDSVTIPRNEGEQAVTDGLSSGIISSNPQLVLDENGNIQRIDGIDTAKLMDLLEMIANNGNVSFDSIDGYLEHITHLLTVSNADANTLNTVVTNLNELAKTQSKSISDINTAVQAIAKAFEKSEESEKVDTDFSGLVIEHTGLVEATAIVEGMPIVQQCRLLLDNLFQSYGGTSTYSSNTSNNTNKAPNFAFYWDSNKDGKTERYNVLDLSFLEYQLSNENLEDKGRFNGGFTVRQFIQYLIILFCYVSFAIKILKKLPSLIGGAGETSDDLNTINRFG